MTSNSADMSSFYEQYICMLTLMDIDDMLSNNILSDFAFGDTDQFLIERLDYCTPLQSFVVLSAKFLTHFIPSDLSTASWC